MSRLWAQSSVELGGIELNDWNNDSWLTGFNQIAPHFWICGSNRLYLMDIIACQILRIFPQSKDNVFTNNVCLSFWSICFPWVSNYSSFRLAAMDIISCRVMPFCSWSYEKINAILGATFMSTSENRAFLSYSHELQHSSAVEVVRQQL